tara:strand:+ start:1615 stop:2454 length:840 start_codon:yes stop_codon:yes gene_type:complete
MHEELDLRRLFENFVKFNTRNKKIVLGSIIIGFFSVVLFQKFKTPYYETKAICTSGIAEYERQEQIEDLSQRTAIDLVNYLQINIENQDFKQISRLLNIEKNIASNIKKIEAEQLYQQDMNEKFYALNKFEIFLTVFDNSVIQDIQNGLIYYFNNNKYITDYYSRYLISNNKIISDIENEISLLSSVRIEGAKNHLDVSSVNIVTGKEGTAISNQIVMLSQLRESIRTQQDLLLPLVFVQDFAKVEQKEDDIISWGLLGAFLSFILGMLISLIREINNK